MSNKDFAETIIKDVGGAENIISVTHCSTRLRFVLKDVKFADTVHLREVRGILGVLMSGDYYMVVIGNRVKKIYDIIKERLGDIEPKSLNPAKSPHKHIFLHLFLYLIPILKIIATVPTLIQLWNENSIDISTKIFTAMDLSANAFTYTLPLIFFEVFGNKKCNSQALSEKIVIFAPAKGKVEKISEHPETEFSDNAYGSGVVVIPESDLIVSPVNGKITSLTAECNAVTISSFDGAEILIHIYGATDSDRKLFNAFVTVGDEVHVGDPLFEFEKNTIEINGVKPLCSVLVTNSENYTSVKPVVSVVQEQQPLMELTFD